MEPMLFALHARKLLASFKGGKIIGSKALAKLIQREGLPWHSDPFGSGRKVFIASELRAWWNERMSTTPRPMRGPGRPRLSVPTTKKAPVAAGTY
jgi:hypothetical protein